jgi:hypothetical protein
MEKARIYIKRIRDLAVQPTLQCAFSLLAHSPPGPALARFYVSELGVRVTGVFLARVAVRGRGGAVAALSVLASCPATRWLSAQAVSRSASARSARTRKASRVSLFQGGDACGGGSGELVQCLPVVSADAGGLVSGGGLGVVRVLDGGDLGPVRLGGVMLGLLGARGGVGDLARPRRMLG